METTEETTEPSLQAEVHLAQAATLEAEGAPEAALRECDAALELLPEWADAHYLRGTLLAALERLPEAIAAFERALELDASLHNAREEWAAAQLRQAAGAYFERAQQLREAGDLNPAYLACRFALALQPEWAAAHNLHGLLLENFGEYARALEAFHRALDLEPALEEARQNERRVTQLLQHEELVVVARYLNVAQAHLAHNLLAVEGIESFVTDESMGGMYGYLSVIGARVMVRAGDAERAEALLKEAFAPLDEETDEEEAFEDEEGENDETP